MSESTQNVLNGDFISRKAAIDTLREVLLKWSYMPAWRNRRVVSKFTSALEEVPTADVREVKHGKWILNKAVANIETYYYHCSECGNERCFIGAYKANWCEECGARMDGEQDVLGK